MILVTKIKNLILLSAFLIPVLLQSQTLIKGTIVDSEDETALSFVNIGIKNKNVGTISSEQGLFSIPVPDNYLNDTLTFSLVGYNELRVPFAQIISLHQQVFPLKIKAVQLKQVDIAVKELKERKYGIKKTKPKIHFIDASLAQNDIFEIAQVIKLSSTPSKLTSVNLLINAPSSDTGMFRINFYSFDGHLPAKRLTEINITEKRIVKEGWLKFDLKRYNIYLQGEITVAIEFIPYKPNNRIFYEVKLGGTSKSFVRSSSLGQWNTSPLHYRIFVTALEDDSQGQPEKDTEEEETIPASRFFSKKVNDTFSLFINLPDNYNKNKTAMYPVVFLLDANVYYDVVVSSVKKINGKNEYVEPIIIGIGYKNFQEGDSLRDRDYTYPKALQKDHFPISGGADKFLAFIENELIPYTDKNFRTDTTNRTLMGHSLGGYFCLFALQKCLQEKAPVFRNYVSASPSIHYHNRFLISQFNEMTVNTGDNMSQTLVLTTGELESKEDGGDADFNSFVNLLSENKFKNVKLDKIIYPQTGHMGTAVQSFEKGLELIMKSK